MRKSCHEHNTQILQAYSNLQHNNIPESISIYQQLLQQQYINKSNNINNKCIMITTIAVLSASIGNYNYAQQIIQQHLYEGRNINDDNNNDDDNDDMYSKTRMYCNLVILKIINKQYQQAIGITEDIKQSVCKISNKKMREELCGLIMRVFFRVEQLTSLTSIDNSNNIVNSNNNSNKIQNMYYLLNITFCQQLLNMGNPKQSLTTLYTNINNNNINNDTNSQQEYHQQIKLILLRQLLYQNNMNNSNIGTQYKSNHNMNQQQIQYEEQIRKFGHILKYCQFDNVEAVACCKEVANTLLSLYMQCSNNDKNNDDINNSVNNNNNDNNNNTILWQVVLSYNYHKLQQNSTINTNEKQMIMNNITLMKSQKNVNIISDMQKSDLYINSIRQITEHINHTIVRCYQKFYQNQQKEKVKEIFEILKDINCNVVQLNHRKKQKANNKQEQSYLQKENSYFGGGGQQFKTQRSKSVKYINNNNNNINNINNINDSSRIRRKKLFINQNKDNHHTLSPINNSNNTSHILSDSHISNNNNNTHNNNNNVLQPKIKNKQQKKQLIHHNHSRSMTNIHTPSQNNNSNRNRLELDNQYTNNTHRSKSNHKNTQNGNTNIAKMLRYCQCGSFLSKRNYNSNGGQYRFVRLSNSIIKWAKNPQKIQDSCQLYPLKDIKSLHYGKCTPNLLKSTNNFLKAELCFSLHLQKRTLDFHCKDPQQARNWVCGLTHRMKTINPKFKGYTRGKLLWKRMFMILRENFTSNLRDHEKNYYYENAQAIVLFAKNGYQLPKNKS